MKHGGVMDDHPDQLRAVWRQTKLPVILRRGVGNPLQVKLPGDTDDVLWRVSAGHWLRSGRHKIPRWDGRFKCWEVPQAWLNTLVRQLLRAFRAIYLIQPYREQEKCAPACFNAQGHDCRVLVHGGKSWARRPKRWLVCGLGDIRKSVG